MIKYWIPPLGLTHFEYVKVESTGSQGIKIFYGAQESLSKTFFLAYCSKGLLWFSIIDGELVLDEKKKVEANWPGSQFIQNNHEAQKIIHHILNPRLWDKKKPFCLLLKATPFQIEVFNELLCIPVGEVRTYKQVAAKIKNVDGFSRAAGQAISKNTIALLIPCHRVVHQNRKNNNYKWGTKLKEQLLLAENKDNEKSITPIISI
jgi:AraC family transcriptional regulator, regulatory protein of adaptative response / methylated-DNA-[protein]-cysteine methyltransferase